MPTIPDWPVLRALRSRRLALPLVLLAGVAVVLLHGSLTRTPAGTPPEASPSPPPVIGPAFRPDLEKTPLSYVSDYWLQLGNGAKAGLALVGSPGTPAIVIAPGLALTSSRAAWELGRAEPAEGPGHPRLLAADDKLELALFEIDAETGPQPFELSDPANLHPGSFVAAVTLAPDGRLGLAPGHLVSIPAAGESGSLGETLELSIVFPRRTHMAALVDLDGKLVGAAVGGRSGVRVLSAAALVRIAQHLRSNPVCHSIDVTRPSEAVRALLAVDGGVVVERVRRASFEREPSVRPGDLLLQWNERKLSGPDEFRGLYDAESPGSLVRLLVRRGAQRVAGRMVMPGRDCRPVGKTPRALTGAGLELRWASGEGSGAGPAGWRVLAVAAGSPAAAAGVTAHDRIVAIGGQGGEQASRRALESYERRPQPLLLTVRRGERTRLVALPARAE